MLLDKEVEIYLNSTTAKYYESLGYYIPKYKDHKGLHVSRYTKIKVKVEDLTKGSHVEIHCSCDYPGCNEIIKRSYKDYLRCNHNGLTYCNKCCQKALFARDKSPNWNPDKTESERNGDRGRNVSEFIKQVMVRDNYVCQYCNNPINGDGVVHHLNGWHWAIDQRYDIDNGVCLCEKCHKNFHMMFGYKNNTKEQFEEFLRLEKDSEQER